MFMRLFIALDMDEEIRQKIRTFVEGARGFAPDARWVRPESLHVTLKFIGEQPEGSLDALERALAQVSGSPFELSFRGYGFFPTPKSARVFWIGIQSGPQLSALASAIDNATEEPHEWPTTVARSMPRALMSARTSSPSARGE